MMDNYLVQHVKSPMRENNLLDLVLIPEIGIMDKVEIIEHLGNNDHNTVVWELICDTSISKRKITN